MSFRSMAGTFHIQNLQCCWESRPAVPNALALKINVKQVMWGHTQNPFSFIFCFFQSPLLVSPNFLWVVGMFLMETNIWMFLLLQNTFRNSLSTFLRLTLCFTSSWLWSWWGCHNVVWEKEMVLFSFWGPENLRGILFSELFPRLFSILSVISNPFLFEDWSWLL